jgi:fructuronate reductase
MTERLSPTTLDRLPDSVQRPVYDREQLRPRMVHLGVGAFHRAHQAVFTEEANEMAGGDWGTVGISLRSSTSAEQLTPQGGLYTVGTRSGEGEERRLVGGLLKVITAPDDPQAAMDALTDPEVAVVTLTITEKGYALHPATGELMFDQADIAHDLTSEGYPRSALGVLARALEIRRQDGSQPLTLVSCDNLPANGRRLGSALVQFASALDPELGRFVDAEIPCPETMVDRIVPATTDEDLQRTAEALGLRDEGYVKTEPFRQWVIEDRFAGPRPAWERAGAMIVPEVAPYETAKLRLLNGPHSAIAYLGYLAGHDFVHEVMADADLARFVTELMDDEIMPTVAEPDGMPLRAYAEDLRARFRNPSLQHRTWQIAMDGSQKLPQRLLGTIRDRIEQGAPFGRLATAVAAWMVYATGRTPKGEPIDVRDPHAERTMSIGDAAGGDPEALLGGYLQLTDVFGSDLPQDDGLRHALLQPLTLILREGSLAAAKAAA